MNRKLSLVMFFLIIGIGSMLAILPILTGQTTLSVFAQPTTGSISGHIYESDGVTPISGAQVWAALSDDGWNYQYYATTGVDGSYIIGNLVGGTYRVRALADGHAYEWYSNQISHDDANFVSVTTGTTTPGIDFTLQPGGSISGYVFKADGSTVITDVLISVHAYGISDGSSSLGTWVSQTDGSYTISGLAPGTYKVQANNNRELGYVTKYYDDKPNWDEADTIEVLAGQTTPGIDFTLEEAASISGYVYEEDGTTPISGAQVWAALSDDGWNYQYHATTDVDGSYIIGSLVAGTYRVRTLADGYAYEWYSNQISHDDANLVSVTTGTTTPGIDFTLQPGGSISGYVFKTDGSTVITDVRLSIHAHGVSTGSSSLGTNVSQTDGSYTISGLAPGIYKVQANNNRELGYVTKYYDDKPNWDEADTIEVFPRQTTSDININLEEAGYISGTIYNADGSSLLSNVMYGFESTTQQGNYTTWCTGDGVFSANLAFGSYKVFAQGDSVHCGGDPNYSREYWREMTTWEEADVITLTSESPSVLGITFTLESGASISGLVTAADGVTPIVSAWVYAMDTHFDYIGGVHSQADGSYQIDALPTGNYYMAVSASSYGGVYYDNGYDDPHATLVNVTAPNDTPDIDFQLSPEATVSGYVYETDGTTPINDASVQVWPVHGGQIRSATTDISGGYTVGGLSTGDYVAKAATNDSFDEYYDNATSWGTATSISVTQPNDTSGIDFTLQQIGIITSSVIVSDTTSTITATTDITTALSFPLGAVSQPITVTIGLTASQPIFSGFRFLGHNFTIEATTATGTLVTTFLKPFTITIHYDDADVEGIDEASLKLYYWDLSAEQWEEIQTTVDIDTNTITAVLDHLTTFAVLGSESEKLKVYLPVILK